MLICWWHYSKSRPNFFGIVNIAMNRIHCNWHNFKLIAAAIFWKKKLPYFPSHLLNVQKLSISYQEICGAPLKATWNEHLKVTVTRWSLHPRCDRLNEKKKKKINKQSKLFWAGWALWTTPLKTSNQPAVQEVPDADCIISCCHSKSNTNYVQTE